MLDATDIRALTFDCYGTLIDWEAGLLAALLPWINVHRLTDDDALRLFARHETLVQQAHPQLPYMQILPLVFNRMCEERGTPCDPALAAALGASVGQWPAFPDTPEALARLKTRFHLIVVSNVDHASFAGTLPRLGVPLDDLVTAQDAGAYKPDPRPLAMALDRLRTRGIVPSQVLHVAQSLYHDHVPAKALGLQTAWVDRRAGRPGGATPEATITPDLRVTTLAQLADILC